MKYSVSFKIPLHFEIIVEGKSLEDINERAHDLIDQLETDIEYNYPTGLEV